MRYKSFIKTFNDQPQGVTMKYIVYKTTNLVNGYIYIGVHHTNNDLKFDQYLGCGVRINKPSTYQNGKTEFQKAVKQFGVHNFKRETLAVFNTAQEAYSMEKSLVNKEFLERTDTYNMIQGGIIKVSQGKLVYQYDSTTGDFIKEFPSCIKAAEELNVKPQIISRAIIAKYHVKSYYFTDYKCNKVNLQLFNGKNIRQVYRYKITGEFDKEFPSVNSAAVDVKGSPGYVQKACLLGYSYKKLYYFSYYKFDTFNKALSYTMRQRKVYKYNSDGKFLCEYNTQEEAENFNIGCNINESIKNKTPDKNGNYWSLKLLKSFNKLGKI